MAILDRSAPAHLGVHAEGKTQPLCAAWRSSWNWTLVPAEVTCPQCLAALPGAAPTARPAPGKRS